MELLFVLAPVVAVLGVLGVYGTVCATFLLELRRLGPEGTDGDTDSGGTG